MRLVTTHDWSSPVDGAHVEAIRRDAGRRSSGGIEHLVLEVLAYAVDEAVEGTTSDIQVSIHRDGSIAVSDDGRGTDTRRDDDGVWQIKPIMSTRDLRFFGAPDAPLLADGVARSGMSVVAALSSWLEHTNVRVDGAWTARYERGLPTELPKGLPARPDRCGTTVHFRPDPDVFGDAAVDPSVLAPLLRDISAARVVLTAA